MNSYRGFHRLWLSVLCVLLAGAQAISVTSLPRIADLRVPAILRYQTPKNPALLREPALATFRCKKRLFSHRMAGTARRGSKQNNLILFWIVFIP
jgi:hypothetical protein